MTQLPPGTERRTGERGAGMDRYRQTESVAKKHKNSVAALCFKAPTSDYMNTVMQCQKSFEVFLLDFRSSNLSIKKRKFQLNLIETAEFIPSLCI